MAQEQTRVLLSNLVGLTLISERITGDPDTDPSHLIQLRQQISKLLAELGFSAKSEPCGRRLTYARAFDQQNAAAK